MDNGYISCSQYKGKIPYFFEGCFIAVWAMYCLQWDASVDTSREVYTSMPLMQVERCTRVCHWWVWLVELSSEVVETSSAGLIGHLEWKWRWIWLLYSDNHLSFHHWFAKPNLNDAITEHNVQDNNLIIDIYKEITTHRHFVFPPWDQRIRVLYCI